MNEQDKLQIIVLRKLVKEKDTSELFQKRKDFTGWLMGWNYENPIMTCEIYQAQERVISSTPEIPQYLNKFHNTRLKIDSETICETDKLQGEKMMFFICETIASLIRNKIHFAVFYAEGMRSPHIKIYDFEELRMLNQMQRVKAQVEFWRRHIPFGLFQFCDTGLFMDNHTLPLEFSIHWKYGTPYNLLFEYLPEEKCNTLIQI